MIVLRDDGLYRHLRFRKPNTVLMGFDILTWPGYLAVSGDMGEYVFSGTSNMIESFGQPKLSMGINRESWAKKCRAADRNGGIDEFSPEVFRTNVLNHIEQYCGGDDASRVEIMSDVEESVFPYLHDGTDALARALDEVEYGNHQVFTDFWECNCRDFTYQFTWVCHAIVWAIHKYTEGMET